MTHPNILEFEQRRARERQAATQIKDGSAPRSTPIDVDRRERTGTAVRLAAKAGVGEMTMQRAIKVRKQGAPEVQKAVVE